MIVKEPIDGSHDARIVLEMVDAAKLIDIGALVMPDPLDDSRANLLTFAADVTKKKKPTRTNSVLYKDEMYYRHAGSLMQGVLDDWAEDGPNELMTWGSPLASTVYEVQLTESAYEILMDAREEYYG